MKQTILRSPDLSCPSCTLKIEKRLRSFKGVTAVNVHFATGKIVVEHEIDAPTADELSAAVQKLGYSNEIARQ